MVVRPPRNCSSATVPSFRRTRVEASLARPSATSVGGEGHSGLVCQLPQPLAEELLAGVAGDPRGVLVDRDVAPHLVEHEHGDR